MLAEHSVNTMTTVANTCRSQAQSILLESVMQAIECRGRVGHYDKMEQVLANAKATGRYLSTSDCARLLNLLMTRHDGRDVLLLLAIVLPEADWMCNTAEAPATRWTPSLKTEDVTALTYCLCSGQYDFADYMVRLGLQMNIRGWMTLTAASVNLRRCIRMDLMGQANTLASNGYAALLNLILPLYSNGSRAVVAGHVLTVVCDKDTDIALSYKSMERDQLVSCVVRHSRDLIAHDVAFANRVVAVVIQFDICPALRELIEPSSSLPTPEYIIHLSVLCVKQDAVKCFAMLYQMWQSVVSATHGARGGYQSMLTVLNRDGCTLLHAAAHMHAAKIADFILEEEPYRVGAVDRFGRVAEELIGADEGGYMRAVFHAHRMVRDMFE